MFHAGLSALVQGLQRRQPQRFACFGQLDPTQEIQLGGVQQRNYSYDPAGRRTGVSGAENATYGYDWRNQPTRTTDDVSGTKTTYDGLGRPVSRETETAYSTEAVTTSFFGATQLGSVLTLHGASSNVWGVFGQLAGIDSEVTGEARWALLDRLGSVVAEAGGIADVTGADIRELASYAEFGLPSYETDGFTSPYGYIGELQDAGTGVVAFASRSYDAGSGTWMAPDAWPGLLVQPQSLNRYAYVLGDPVTLIDVGGFKPAPPVLDKKTVLNPSALLNHYTPNGGPGTWNATNAYGDRALTSIGQTVTAGTGGSSPNTVSQTILQDRHANTVRVCTSLSAKASCGPPGLPGVKSRMQSGNSALIDWNSVRQFANGPVTSFAKGIAELAGGTCRAAENGLIVCHAPALNVQGGTTYGEVFITDKKFAEVFPDSGLLVHEQNHSVQWAVFGPTLFPVFYGLEMATSTLETGHYGCANLFEITAGLKEGRYLNDCGF